MDTIYPDLHLDTSPARTETWVCIAQGRAVLQPPERTAAARGMLGAFCGPSTLLAFPGENHNLHLLEESSVWCPGARGTAVKTEVPGRALLWSQLSPTSYTASTQAQTLLNGDTATSAEAPFKPHPSPTLLLHRVWSKEAPHSLSCHLVGCAFPARSLLGTFPGMELCNVPEYR